MLLAQQNLALFKNTFLYFNNYKTLFALFYFPIYFVKMKRFERAKMYLLPTDPQSFSLMCSPTISVSCTNVIPRSSLNQCASETSSVLKLQRSSGFRGKRDLQALEAGQPQVAFPFINNQAPIAREHEIHYTFPNVTLPGMVDKQTQFT